MQRISQVTSSRAYPYWYSHNRKIRLPLCRIAWWGFLPNKGFFDYGSLATSWWRNITKFCCLHLLFLHLRVGRLVQPWVKSYLFKERSANQESLPVITETQATYFESSFVSSTFKHLCCIEGRILDAAFSSLSWWCPHDGHVHSRTFKSLTALFRYPQWEHICDDGAKRLRQTTTLKRRL